MKIISIDPSSTLTGFAVFENGALISGGYLTPDNKKDKAIDRFLSISKAYRELIYEKKPDVCIIETTNAIGGHKGRRGFSLFTYGMAVGAMIQIANDCCLHVEYITVSEWSGRKTKTERAKILIAEHPHMAEVLKKDRGGDLCDAIMLGKYYLNNRSVKDVIRKQESGNCRACDNAR